MVRPVLGSVVTASILPISRANSGGRLSEAHPSVSKYLNSGVQSAVFGVLGPIEEVCSVAD